MFVSQGLTLVESEIRGVSVTKSGTWWVSRGLTLS